MNKKSCIVALLLTVVIAAFLALVIKHGLTPRNLANEEPRRAFESFVCLPPPQSVREIKANGVDAVAGGHASIEFQLDPSDINDLIQRGKFQLANGSADEWIREYKPEGITGNIVRYVRINEGTSRTALFFTEDRCSAHFYKIQL